MRDGGCRTDKKAVYCHNEGEERGGEVDGEGRMDGCVERIFTSVNSRVIALITAVNNSKPLVGNSLRERRSSRRGDITRSRTPLRRTLVFARVCTTHVVI